MPPTCQLVIPSYRDGGRLEPFLEELARTLPAQFAVQIVDDGSGPEETVRLQEILRRIAGASTEGPQFRAPLLLPQNRGKGAAVRAGWEQAGDADLAGFADADGSVNAGEILRGYEFLCRELDLLDGLIGSRVQVLGRTVKRRWVRHFCGRVFATAVHLISGLPIYDTQCGFKLLKTSALRPVLPRLRSDRFSFDVELLLELMAAGVRLREFPVDWIHRHGSKVSMLRDALPMLVDVWRVTRRVKNS